MLVTLVMQSVKIYLMLLTSNKVTSNKVTSNKVTSNKVIKLNL
jgi:hypothetical protein